MLKWMRWGRACSNSLAPKRCGCDFISTFFKLILRIDVMNSSCEICLRWMPQNPIDDKSTLVQVMGWCHQATSYHLNLDRDLWRHMVSLGNNELITLRPEQRGGHFVDHILKSSFLTANFCIFISILLISSVNGLAAKRQQIWKFLLQTSFHFVQALLILNHCRFVSVEIDLGS